MTDHHQRIRGAIDRTIAEEQARQLKTTEGAAASKPARAKKTTFDASEAAVNPDPAVFEAAFVLDDSDEPSRAATPKPALPEKDTTEKDKMNDDKTINEKEEAATADADVKKAAGKDDGSPEPPKKDTDASKPSAELSPEIKQRLRKLEKLEATYPGKGNQKNSSSGHPVALRFLLADET